jgi:hypothetical protein
VRNVRVVRVCICTEKLPSIQWRGPDGWHGAVRVAYERLQHCVAVAWASKHSPARPRACMRARRSAHHLLSSGTGPAALPGQLVVGFARPQSP